MIIDKLENINNYKGAHPLFEKAFDALKDFARANKEVGKYDIDGDNVYIKVQSYKTKFLDEGKWENHKKYIDIQFVLKGEEKVFACDRKGLETSVPYSEEKDVEYTKAPKSFTETVLHPGEFAVFFPGEVHLPALCAGSEKTDVNKILVKIKAQ